MNTALEVRRKRTKLDRARNGQARKPCYNSADKKILAGLEDGLALLEGRASAGTLGNVRLVYLPDPLGKYRPPDVLALRNRLGVSQIAFARLLGASLSLVQSWEQGRRSPNPMACRLLDEVARGPGPVGADVRPNFTVKSTARLKMSHDVFVSHSSKDKAAADAIVAALEQQGVTCWIAPRDIPAGATWGAAIIAGIEGSRVMVLIFSSRADSSPQVLREVERAVAKGVTVVPVRIEDVAMSKDLEYFLSARHWLDALDRPLGPQLERVVAAVRGILHAPGTDAARGTSARPAVGPSVRHSRWAVAAAAAGLIVAAALVLAVRPWGQHGEAGLPTTATAGTTAPAIITAATRPDVPAVLPARYAVTDLGTLGGEESESGATAINDAGQVVGDTDVTGPFVDGHPPHHAFLWTGGKMTDLGTLGGPNSSATAINGRGQIAGLSDTAMAGETHAFLYDSGRMTDLGTLGGKKSEAYGINAAGDVVGKTETGESGDDGPVQRTFIYRAGKMTDLGAWGRRCSTACAIDDAGRIAGDVFDRQTYLTPFIVTDGHWVGLGAFAGSGHAQAIDGAGDVVGSAQSPENGGEFHAFIYRDGRRYDLGTLGGKISYGYGIDRSGRVLGGSRVASEDDTRLHAFVADATGLHDLNRLVPADARCVLTAARAANSAGAIVGEAEFPTGRHGFVLTPDMGGR